MAVLYVYSILYRYSFGVYMIMLSWIWNYIPTNISSVWLWTTEPVRSLSNNLVSKSIQHRQLALISPIVVQCKCSRYIPNLCLIEQIFKASLINLGFLLQYIFSFCARWWYIHTYTLTTCSVCCVIVSFYIQLLKESSESLKVTILYN